MPTVELHRLAVLPEFRNAPINLTAEQASYFGLGLDSELRQGDRVRLLTDARSRYPFVPDMPLIIAELVNSGDAQMLKLKSIATGQVFAWVRGTDVQKTSVEETPPMQNMNVASAARRFESRVLALTAIHGAKRAYEMAVQEDKDQNDGADYAAYLKIPGTVATSEPVHVEPTHAKVDDSRVKPILERVAAEHGLNLRHDLGRVIKLVKNEGDRAAVQEYLDEGRC